MHVCIDITLSVAMYVPIAFYKTYQSACAVAMLQQQQQNNNSSKNNHHHLNNNNINSKFIRQRDHITSRFLLRRMQTRAMYACVMLKKLPKFVECGDILYGIINYVACSSIGVGGGGAVCKPGGYVCAYHIPVVNVAVLNDVNVFDLNVFECECV